MMRERLRLLAQAVRAPFLPVTAIPVLLGAAVATAETRHLLSGRLFLTLLGCLALHAGANAANDYYDWLSGADVRHQPWRYSGGSQVLQLGRMRPGWLRRLYRSLYLLALVVGCYLAWLAGPTALLIGLSGLALGHWYTAPPIAFSYRGWGEVVTGLTFGPLVVLGSYFVQTGRLSWAPLLVSLPVGLLITAVLYVNEFPDYRLDVQAGKRNWVVLTRGQAAWVYHLLVCSAAGLTLLMLLRLRPWLALAGIPLIWLAIRPLHDNPTLSPERLLPVQSGTRRLHALTGLTLTLVYFLSGLA